MEKLPVEICQVIFLSALPYESFLERSSPTRDHAANFHIAATCARWRNIALQTPSLWARIKVHGLCDDWILQYVSLHLEHSGTFPLELRFSLERIEMMEPASKGAAYSRCLQLAGEDVHRWSRIHIELPYWMTSGDLVMLTERCPLLEEVVLLPVPETNDYRSGDMLSDAEDSDMDSAPILPARYFRDARHLVRLESHATPMVPVHPLERLTFLSISLRDVPDISLWQTLAMTPNLQELCVYYPIYGSGRSDDPPSVTINLPHLTKLALYGLPDSFEWIDFFDAPKVTTLAVSIEPCPRLNRLFIKLRDTVRHLIITTVDPTDGGGFLNVTDAVALDHLSMLDTFEIRNLTKDMLQQWNGSFFDHLVDRAREREGWVARLRRFVINGCTFYLAACESLLEFIQEKYKMAGEEKGFMCELLEGTVFLRSPDESENSLDTLPQAFRDAVVTQSDLSDEWVDEDEDVDVDDEGESEGDGDESGEPEVAP